MSWHIADNRGLFRFLSSILRHHLYVLTTPKTSLGKFTPTLVEFQQIPDIEKSDPGEESSCLKCTIYNGTRKVCVSMMTGTDKSKNIVFRNRNNLYVREK